MRFLLVAGATVATIAASLSVQAPAQTGEAKEQLLCTNHVPTGTRFARRTCRTRAERNQVSEEQRRNAAEMINRPMINRVSEVVCDTSGSNGAATNC